MRAKRQAVHLTMEIELKLNLDREAAARWKAQLQAQGAERQVLRAIYFDTDDSRLAAAGLSLRLRCENGRWVQTLKAPGKDAVERLEHELALDAPADDTPALDLQRHHGTPAGAALADVRLGAASPMRQRFHTDVERWHLRVSTATGTAIDVALDSGSVQSGDRRLNIAELEAEWREGPLAGLFDLVADVLREGGARLAFESKATSGHCALHTVPYRRAVIPACQHLLPSPTRLKPEPRYLLQNMPSDRQTSRQRRIAWRTPDICLTSSRR